MFSAERLGLVRALAGADGCDLAGAGAVLERARRLGVDPLQVIANRFALSQTEIHRRAATLFGVAFVARPEGCLRAPRAGVDVDTFSSIRSARAITDGHEVVLTAPNFEQLMVLGPRLRDQPGLSDRIAITTPAGLRGGLATAGSEHLSEQAIHRLARTVKLPNAHLDLTRASRTSFVVVLGILMAVVFLAPVTLQALLLPILTVLLAAPSLFRLWAAATAHGLKALEPAHRLTDHELPVYSVMIPLRDEANMVPQIASAMRRFDYPAEKLDVLFVVEDSSPETVAAVRQHLDDQRFGLVVVPRSGPLTKPKALNYALPLARGNHVVVFDAEDIPDRGQLRTAASVFAERRDLECLQAELLIANGTGSWVTALFAAEYAGHFGVLLPAIAKVGLPMPLGGTSNHFRVATLRSIGGWDAFNVTEDADLGTRLARFGMGTACIAGWTVEEAPRTEKAWLKQRTRWMKGWMQTFLVHNRRLDSFLMDLGPRNFLAFQVFVGGMFVSIGIHGVFFVLVLARMIANLITDGIVDAWTYAHLVTLALSYCGPLAVSVVGLRRIGRLDLAPMLVLTPLYWLLGWVAVMRGAFELLVRPFHWDKTAHFGFEVIKSDRISGDRPAGPLTTGSPTESAQSSRSRPA